MIALVTKPIAPRTLNGLQWVPTILESGDSLEKLGGLYNVDPVEITTANDVDGAPHSCPWGVSIAQWCLHEGKFAGLAGPKGFRQPVVPSQPNHCEPGHGFPSFGVGQVILLPNKPGITPRKQVGAGGVPAPTSSSSSFNFLGLAIVAVGIATKSVGITAVGAATTLGFGPLGQIGK